MSVPAAEALKVPFNELRSKVARHRGAIEGAVARVLDRGWFILGPEVEEFEKELARASGMPDAVAVGNGTDALILALEARGVKPGDEVITSPMSAAFSALAISRLGAIPVFGEVDERTLNLDPASIEARVTAKTRAILPVHLYGHPADMDPILDIARRHSIVVVEDACQAQGARYRGRPVGAPSGMAALSFYPTKNLGALGDGGAILVADASEARLLRRLRNGGQGDRYRHEIVGTNTRLDEMQAAILREFLKALDGETARRRAIVRRYDAAFAGLPIDALKQQSYAEAVHHLYVVRHRRREAFMRALRAHGVGTLIHYPIPLHLQPAYASLGGRRGDRPKVERAADEIVSLPVYPELTDEQIDLVIAAVKDAAGATLEGDAR